jgi:hypothetical protein
MSNANLWGARIVPLAVTWAFLYGFKGAPSAPGRGWPPIVEAQRAEQLTGSAAVNGPFPGHRHWGTVTRRGAACRP